MRTIDPHYESRIWADTVVALVTEALSVQNPSASGRLELSIQPELKVRKRTYEAAFLVADELIYCLRNRT
jgi:hypothetical protein